MRKFLSPLFGILCSSLQDCVEVKICLESAYIDEKEQLLKSKVPTTPPLPAAIIS